ncbi:MAG: T9SS type A sorting domain-containing protein [Crocinitomicaceae bacterium]|nr:T9SS type A sorting domain-containing protein [Flavobacteriales bacterium]NQZ35339.1 T9SS type A sorting domain-containing protein [Crocinitomicaceae bacterium]
MKYIFLTLFIYANACFAQISFQNLYGGVDHDIGHSVEQTSDGGYIVLGQSESFGTSQDLYLLKTDAYGVEEWSQTYGSSNWEWGISVKQTADGGYILCGGWEGPSDDSLVLLKTDPNGVEEWNYRFSGSIDRDVGQSVIETSDGGYAACGFTSAYPNEDVFVVKTNSSGIEEWSSIFSGPAQEVSRTIRQTSDNGFFVFGSTNSYGAGQRDYYLLRLDAAGDSLWTKTYGTIDDEEGTSMHINSDGSIVLIGYEYFNGGNIYVIKADANGNIIWDEYYGGTGWDIGYSIKQTSDNGFVLSGRKDNTNLGGTNDMYCIKTNQNGVVDWEFSYPLGFMSDASCVQQTNDGGYIMTGSSIDSLTFDSDVILLKIPGNGVLNLFESSISVDVSVYPNPFVDYTIISLNDYINPVDIIIYSSDGKILYRELNISGAIRIEGRHLQKGLNLFKIEDNGKEIASGKIVMQ